MMQNKYCDCYATLEGNLLYIGNSRIERVFDIEGGLKPVRLTDKISGDTWGGNCENGAIGPNVVDCDAARVGADVFDSNGAWQKCLRCTVTYSNAALRLTHSICIFPNAPFISMNYTIFAQGEGSAIVPNYEYDIIDELALPAEKCIDIKTILFTDKTDQNDWLVTTDEQELYKAFDATGSIFIFSDRASGNALLMAKDAPSPSSRLGVSGDDVMIYNHALMLRGSGLIGHPIDAEGFNAYGATVGVGKADEMPALYRDYYARMTAPEKCYVMSNTWGDRSKDAAVCEKFLIGEIDVAARLGADMVQIDDGWQTGKSMNSAFVTNGRWSGFYQDEVKFWDVDSQKFPRGLKWLCEYAAGRGVKIGLWFNPDSDNDYENWRNDAAVLREFAEQGVAGFKLDGVVIASKTGERNFLRLLETIRGFGDGMILNLDITASDRLGYVYHPEYGTLFVENRYSDHASYHPHCTLRNLWALSRYIPSTRFQFELLNIYRNADKYEGYPFAPNKFTMDYLFASVMVANPLLWMELQHLPLRDAERLAGIMRVYNAIRAEIMSAKVRPIGDMPNGLSFTGFDIDCDNHGYLILLRELGNADSFDYQITAARSISVVYTDLNANEYEIGEGARVKMAKQASYLVLKYTK